MPSPKPLSKEMIIRAMNKTKSNLAASRYLNVSLQHYRKWAKIYEATEPGYKDLYEQHKNQCGKGIPKFLRSKGKEPPLLDLIEGRINGASFNPDKIKYRLVTEGYLKEECALCGMHERRVSDYKMPILLNFKDGNKKNYKLENVEFLCYNCYYLTVDDIFTEKQLKGIEDHRPVSKGQVDWDLDDYTLQRLKELGLGDDDEDDPMDLVARL